MNPPKHTFQAIFSFALLTTLAACTLFTQSTVPATQAPALTVVLSTPPPTTAPVTPTFPDIITATEPPPTATTEAIPPAEPSQAPSITPTQGTGVRILNYKMFDTKAGWSVGQYLSIFDDQLLRTTDGGKTWSDVLKHISPAPAGIKGNKASAAFLDAGRAWITFTPRTPEKLDNVTIWRTSDGGSTFKAGNVDVKSLTGDYFAPSELGFFDENTGWLMAHMGVGMMKDYVAILTTKDGGGTWKVAVDPGKNNLPATGTKTGVVFTSPETGFVSGDYNGVMAGLLFFKTGDGGATWVPVSLPDPAGAAGIFTKEGNACGGDGLVFHTAQWGELMVRCTNLSSNKSSRWLYTTLNGGISWTSKALPGPWGQLYTLDMNSAWYLSAPGRDVVSGSKMYQTKDDSKNWVVISSPINWTGQMQYVDANNGWVNAASGGTAVLVRSVDGGVSWGLVNPSLAP